MPRFRNTTNESKSASTPPSSEAISRQCTKVDNEGSSKIEANTIDSAAAAPTNDQDDFGIEEDYFSSEFTFDYDTDDNNPATPLWSNAGIDDETTNDIVETPKSILKDYSNSSQQQLNPESFSSMICTSAEKKNRISFRTDVDFRKKTTQNEKGDIERISQKEE